MTIYEQTGLTEAELAGLCQQREAMYALIARMFIKEPDQAFLDELRQREYPVSTGNNLVDQGNRKLATYLSNVWENSALELAVDYVRTFIGYGMDGKSAAYPYESAYTTTRRLLMQGARDEVRAIYASAGLDKLSSLKDEDDHVAFELSFMRTMCERTAAAAKAGDEDTVMSLIETQANFLEQHLGLWAPTFAREMRTFAKTDFYQAASLLLEGFIEIESELFSIDYYAGGIKVPVEEKSE